MGVGVGVVHDLVPRVMEGFDGFGVLIHPCPHHEEGGLYLILIQDVDELLGVLVAPGRVKADGHNLLIPLYAVNWQLTRGSGGAHGRRVVDEKEHNRRQAETADRSPPFFTDEKDLNRMFIPGHSTISYKSIE